MGAKTEIKLSRLREIGWALWDPIGLRKISGGEWQEGGACADEYDSYLLQVVGKLRSGMSPDDAAAYLEEIETDYMGLGRSVTTGNRAKATVAAINDYLGTALGLT